MYPTFSPWFPPGGQVVPPQRATGLPPGLPEPRDMLSERHGRQERPSEGRGAVPSSRGGGKVRQAIQACGARGGCTPTATGWRGGRFSSVFYFVHEPAPTQTDKRDGGRFSNRFNRNSNLLHLHLVLVLVLSIPATNNLAYLLARDALHTLAAAARQAPPGLDNHNASAGTAGNGLLFEDPSRGMMKAANLSSQASSRVRKRKKCVVCQQW